ncbi:MAG: hypothetical protein KTR13_04050 [Saprospiraceae bacterium]|nr:hypothetical protein [Saprospiraceae bacterium]
MKQVLNINEVPREIFDPIDGMNYWDSPMERGVRFLQHKLKFRKFIRTEEGVFEFTEASPDLPYGGIKDHKLVFSSKKVLV